MNQNFLSLVSRNKRETDLVSIRTEIYFCLFRGHPSWGPSPFSSWLLAQWGNLPRVPSRDSNSGLPYSKPVLYQLSHAAPWTEPSCTLTEPRRTLTEPRRTLNCSEEKSCMGGGYRYVMLLYMKIWCTVSLSQDQMFVHNPSWPFLTMEGWSVKS